MQNGTAALEENLAVSYKTKHIHVICSNNHALWYSSKEVDNLCTDVYSNSIHTCQYLETTNVISSR
jgi:hypothetical protein